MNLSLTIGPLTPEQLAAAVQALAHLTGGQPSNQPSGMQAGMPPPPTGAPPANRMPPPQAVAPPPPPPPQAAPTNTKLDEVLRAMDGYARAGHQVAGARKVLNVLSLQRAQDANEEQLDWLLQAFSNHNYVPA